MSSIQLKIICLGKKQGDMILNNKDNQWKEKGHQVKQIIYLVNKETKITIINTGLSRLKCKRIHLPVLEAQVQSLGQERLLEEKMGTHLSTLAWEILWTEGPVGYSPWGCRVRHDLLQTTNYKHSAMFKKVEEIINIIKIDMRHIKMTKTELLEMKKYKIWIEKIHLMV